MKHIDNKGNFVEADNPKVAYQVKPNTREGKRLIASLRGEKLNESPVITARQFIEEPEEEEAPEIVEETKPKVTRKKRNG